MTLLLPNHSHSDYQSGFTLLELMIAVAIVAIFTAIALPSYNAYIERANNTEPLKCLLLYQTAIQRYHTIHYQYPEALSDVGSGGECAVDPWGNPYRYLKIEGKKGKGKNRKDRSENPLNSDYDLYSMGKDGKTSQSLRPKVSHDDIIRAKNGTYFGLASDY